MEKDLLTWKDFYMLDNFIYKFTTVKLLQDISPFKKGKELPFAVIDYDTGILTLDNTQIKLKLIVDDEY